MDPAAFVSQGSLQAIFNQGENPENAEQFPILQVLQIKGLPAQTPDGPQRFRVVLSDISNFVQSMLASQISSVVQEGRMQKGCFVRLKSFQASQVKDKRIMIVLDLEVVEELGQCDKIGEPKALEPSEAKAQPTTISSDGFYGNRIPPQQQQQPVAQQWQSRPGGGQQSHPALVPIEALSPYSHRWTIKARCTHKGEIKHWHNKNGEGKLFSANFLDETGEIRATGFNEQCDALYDVLQEGSVYYISTPCKVQLAKKQFTNLNNDYELTFERETLVEKAEDQNNVPQVRYNFTTIGDLQSVEKDTTIDVIGVLKDVGEVSQITSKTTSKPYDKRELTLVDNTGYSVRLTIWGNTATSFDVPQESIIAFKGVKVSDFGGRSLSLLSSGSMAVNPDINEAHRLKGWYDAGGGSDTFSTHASIGMASGMTGGKDDAYKTIAEVREENLGMSEKPDYFILKATIIYIKQDNVSYPACLSEGCNKKVVEIEAGQWRCERCDKSYPKPQHRYIMSISVSDHTGQIWLSCFDEVGRLVMGLTADELFEKREENEKAVLEIFQEANCRTWVFKCRAKMDNFQDQQRVRYQVVSANPLNYQAEANRLTEILALYNLE